MKKDTDKQNLESKIMKSECEIKVINSNGLAENIQPDPEVLSKKKVRRIFTTSYKRKILEEADKCSKGELGALLRKKGLYSATISLWRKQRESGIVSALANKKRGVKTPLDSDRIKELERKTVNLSDELKKARMIIEVQKKISEIFLPETLPISRMGI